MEFGSVFFVLSDGAAVLKDEWLNGSSMIGAAVSIVVRLLLLSDRFSKEDITAQQLVAGAGRRSPPLTSRRVSKT